MKQILERMKAGRKVVTDTTARIARAQAEQAKYTEASAAARQEADARRAAAHRLLALAAVGDGNDADAAHELAEADRLRDRADVLAATAQALAEEVAQAERTRDEARADQLRATREAIAAQAQAAAAEFRAAHTGYITAFRRLRALEALGREVGDPRKYLVGVHPELELPRCDPPQADDPQLVGAYADCWWSARGDLGGQEAATQAERERLAALGFHP